MDRGHGRSFDCSSGPYWKFILSMAGATYGKEGQGGLSSGSEAHRSLTKLSAQGTLPERVLGAALGPGLDEAHGLEASESGPRPQPLDCGGGGKTACYDDHVSPSTQAANARHQACPAGLQPGGSRRLFAITSPSVYLCKTKPLVSWGPTPHTACGSGTQGGRRTLISALRGRTSATAGAPHKR